LTVGGNWLGVRGCGVVDVGLGGHEQKNPFLYPVREREDGRFNFFPLVLYSYHKLAYLYSKFAWVITFIEIFNPFFYIPTL
jgi:hypothetical protein